MRGKTIAALAAATASLALPAVAGARDQSVIPYQAGDPHANGCPSGWEALDVGVLAGYGYQVPALLDSTANGDNGDGVVCGHPWTPQEQAARLPDAAVPVVFDFEENGLHPLGA